MFTKEQIDAAIAEYGCEPDIHAIAEHLLDKAFANGEIAEGELELAWTQTTHDIERRLVASHGN